MLPAGEEELSVVLPSCEPVSCSNGWHDKVCHGYHSAMGPTSIIGCFPIGTKACSTGGSILLAL